MRFQHHSQSSFDSPRWPEEALDTDTESPDSKSWDLRSYYYCGLAFLLGVLHFWAVSLVGQMPVAELLVLFLLGQTALMVALNLRLRPCHRPGCFPSSA
jgi:hypothetical protein